MAVDTAELKEFQKECEKIYINRNKMYKDVWKEYELITNADHSKGKMKRIIAIAKTFMKRGINLTEIEAAQDDLVDVSNYCFFVYWQFEQLKKKLEESGNDYISDDGIVFPDNPEGVFEI